MLEQFAQTFCDSSHRNDQMAEDGEHNRINFISSFTSMMMACGDFPEGARKTIDFALADNI